MCILSYLPPNVEPDLEGLLNGGINNPDGHGWAITDRSTIIVGKSMSLETALDDFETARKKHMSGHALFHSRWATHGKLDTSNVHPFVVGGSDLTVVAHNGILPAAAWPAKKDPRSDTRIFADEILSTQYRRLDKPGARHALKQWIGTGNKLVILTVDPKYRENAYIVNEDKGHWDTLTGLWHSNHDYLWVSSWAKPVTTTIAVGANGKPLPWWEQQETTEDCLMCNYGRVNQATNFCSECGTCQDCFEHSRDCQCFQRGRWLDAYKSDAELEDDRRFAEEQAEERRLTEVHGSATWAWSDDEYREM